jgi:hypothetical protein
MSDVDKLFKRLVEVLAARGEPSLQDPIELQDLYQKIIPYRLHRTALRFDSNQDYEMALLRLLAGENGYLEVEPADVAAALAREARSVNPNPGAFRAFGQARAKLSFRAVREILDSRAAYEPPDVPEPALPPEPPAPSAPSRIAHRLRELPFDFEPTAPAAEPRIPATPVTAKRTSGPACPQCGGELPQGRTVNFCPHCGGDVRVRECAQCGAQMDVSWRHCVSCGYRVK